MNKTMIGGTLRRSVAALACLAAGALPAAAANEALALQAGNEYLMVANYPNNLNVVDLASERVYKTCALPDAFGPGTTQIAPDRRTAYILNNRFGTIYGIDLDSCKLTFRAEMSLGDNERAKSIASFTVSPDGKELYAVQNPTRINRDHYRVGEPRFAVYDTSAGLEAKPVRVFPAPRQANIMQAGDDGAVYLAGPNLYKVDVKTGKTTVALPIRDWTGTRAAAPRVSGIWPVQTPQRDFTILYTTAKFEDDKQDMATAEYQYGYLNVNLKSGETEAREFGPLTEIYFTGVRSPKDPNLIYGVLNRLAKYDIKQKKLLAAAEIPYSFYTVSMNRDGSKVYLGGTWNSVAVYDAGNLKPLTMVNLPGGDMGAASPQVFTR